MSDSAKILKLIAGRESSSVEFKTCRSKLNRDVYESVCAFLNRHGGDLLLGVRNDETISGIDKDALEQVRKDFVTGINNPQKLTPPAYLSINEVEIDGKTILHIYVPESSQVHRCKGRIYDSNEDGDLDITDQSTEVSKLYQRKQATYSENKILPWVGVDDLRKDLREKCRRLATVWRDDHPWATLGDAELLVSAQLMQTDPQSRESGITLAGVMLLGTDATILQACPAHRTDLILRRVDTERYDDRDLVRTNLIESYERILEFVRKHLSDPFHLEGTDRVSLRDVIFREVASNMFIHREYASGVPSRLVIERDKVSTQNPNRPHGMGPIDPASFAPFPKNPVIGAFFREIHRADELGSGMRKLTRYGKHYGGRDPQLIEGDIFRMEIAVPAANDSEAGSATTPKTTPKPQTTTPKTTQEKILETLREQPGIGRSQLAERLNITTDGVIYHLNRLRDTGRIRHAGPARGGHWEVLQ